MTKNEMIEKICESCYGDWGVYQVPRIDGFTDKLTRAQMQRKTKTELAEYIKKIDEKILEWS